MTDSNAERLRLVDNRLREAEIELGKVRQRVDDHEGDIRVFASMPTELEKIRWAQEKATESISAAHAAIRELSARIDVEHEDRIKGQVARKLEVEEALAERNAEMAKIEEQQQARYSELQARADQQRLENRRLLIGLVTIFLTSATSVLIALLTGGGPA